MRYLLFPLVCLITISANAYQEQPLRELDRTMATYYQNASPLKVHLTINQPSYVAGDTIFFRASVVNEADKKAIDKNTILHVMMMNPEGEAVTNQKVRLENGTASNQLIIPGSLKPGLYVLVAYHDWMKNSSPEFFFQTFILIHGPLQFVATQPNTLEFFPEGGHLTAGVENRVVVKGPPGTIGVVTDGGGQQQATFTTTENGFGSFVLKPSAGVTYNATAKNKSFALPQSEAEGIALMVQKNENESRLNVSIVTAQESIQRVRVIVDATSKVYYNNLLKLDQGKLSATIPTTEIAQGVTRVSVFGEKGNLLAERLVFISANGADAGTLTLDGSRFNTRQKVTAKVKVSSELSGTLLSVSIFNKTLYNQPARPSVTANLALYSNVSGSLTHASQGFAPMSQAWQESVDMLLIASKKTRAPWADVFQKNQQSDRNINIRFAGQLINEKTGALMTDTTFVTLFLQKNVVTYQTFTNKGRFDLPLYIDFFGKDEVYYRIEKRGKPVPDVRIEVVEEPALSIDWPVVTESTTPDPVFVNARQQKLITNAFGYNKQAQNYKKVLSLNAAIEEEIFGANHEIDLEKYLVFPTMEETIREIVPMVQHRKIKNVSTLRVYFSDINKQATVGPIYIIDGVMTDDTDYFMRLKPTEVSKIKVVNTREKLKTFGAIGRGGVIMVETKLTDNFSKVPRSKNSFIVHGLSDPANRKLFSDASFKDRTPDLRSSLYWNPEIRIDDDGEATFTFYTSDVTGDYAIILEGIAPSGEPVFIEGGLSVEYKPEPN
jgi:hypothetical protein